MKKKPELKDFIKLSIEEKRALQCFNESELQDIEAFQAYMSQLELKVEVQNADNLVALDFVIFDITVRRTNLQPSEEVSYVHSNTYPFLK